MRNYIYSARDFLYMPSHKIHKKIDKIVLKKEYPDVHKWLDEPVKHYGFKHRIRRHSFVEIAAKYHNDPARFLSAYMHLVADYSDSYVKREIRKHTKMKSKKGRR